MQFPNSHVTVLCAHLLNRGPQSPLMSPPLFLRILKNSPFMLLFYSLSPYACQLPTQLNKCFLGIDYVPDTCPIAGDPAGTMTDKSPFSGGASISNERPSMVAPLQIPKRPEWCCPPCQEALAEATHGSTPRVETPPFCSLPHLVTLCTEATLLLPCGSGRPRGIRVASASSCSNTPPPT